MAVYRLQRIFSKKNGSISEEDLKKLKKANLVGKAALASGLAGISSYTYGKCVQSGNNLNKAAKIGLIAAAASLPGYSYEEYQKKKIYNKYHKKKIPESEQYVYPEWGNSEQMENYHKFQDWSDKKLKESKSK